MTHRLSSRRNQGPESPECDYNLTSQCAWTPLLLLLMKQHDSAACLIKFPCQSFSDACLFRFVFLLQLSVSSIAVLVGFMRCAAGQDWAWVLVRTTRRRPLKTCVHIVSHAHTCSDNQPLEQTASQSNIRAHPVVEEKASKKRKKRKKKLHALHVLGRLGVTVLEARAILLRYCTVADMYGTTYNCTVQYVRNCQ